MSAERPTFLHELQTAQLSRRDLIRTAIFLGIIAKLESASSENSFTHFMTEEDYEANLPQYITLSAVQAKKEVVAGVGSSYVEGTGAQSPVQLLTEFVTQNGIGEWKSDVVAIAGSFLTDFPNQLTKIHQETRESKPICITDSGPNSVTKAILSKDPDALQQLSSLIGNERRVGISDLFDLAKRISILSKAALNALDEHEEKLFRSYVELANSTQAENIFFYTFPPLQYANAFTLFPQPGEHLQEIKKLPIYGNALLELLARRLEHVGTNRALRAAERAQQKTSKRFVPILLRNVLQRSDFEDSEDEHPTMSGYLKMRDDHLRRIFVSGQSITSLA